MGMINTHTPFGPSVVVFKPFPVVVQLTFIDTQSTTHCKIK